MPTFWSVSCFCAMTTGMVTAAEQADAGAKARIVAGPVCETGPSALLPALVSEEGMMEPPAPLPPNVEVRRVVVTAGAEDAVVAGSSAGPPLPCEDDPAAVYCNTLGQWTVGVVGTNPDLILADDIATTAVAGCYLDRYVVKVTGDVHGDGTGVGPYDVHVALYTACPSAGGSEIRGTAKDVTIPDNRTTTIEVTINPAYDIPLPASLYVGVKFSRVTAGTVMGAPATVGFSADFFDSPHAPCLGWYGGFPANPHGSFYAEIYVRPDCPSAFVGYKNSNHAGRGFSPGGSILFADDITLGVRECDMVAYEVAVEGTGRTDFHLRRFLTEDMIPDTDGWTMTTVWDGPVIKRVEIDPPIGLEFLFIVFETSGSDVGPILTGKQADVGSTEDLYWIYDGIQWIPHGEVVYSAFDVSIWCAGLPPTGACCDMILPSFCLGGDNDGYPCLTDGHCRGAPCVSDGFCREVPEMNCPYPVLWEEEAMCESACVGGDNDGQPCTRQADCPDGDCPGPFAHPCGVSACCKPDDTCEDLTEKQCFELEPVEYDPQRYQLGSFCGEGEQRCPRYACGRRVGDCTLARPEPGCADPFCCSDVCSFDPWCCHVAWDELCVRWYQELCDPRPPRNDSCFDPDPDKGALLVDANSSTVVGTVGATEDASDPRACCHSEDPLSFAQGTVWFRFEATHTTARIHTCDSVSPASDSIIQVFKPGDPATPETACNTLARLVCSDDAPGCAAGSNSDVCASRLVPGETYYVMLGAKTEDTLGAYRLDIESPCTPSEVLEDYALFSACLTGPCGSDLCASPLYADDCCAYADLNGDGDVDLSDFAAFQAAFTGP